MQTTPGRLPAEPPEHGPADRIHGILWLTVALAFVTLVLTLVSPDGDDPSPIIGTELASNWRDVQNAIQFATQNSQVGMVRASLACDFLFLLGYATLFVWMAKLAAGWLPGLARITAALAIAAAVFDCAENVGALVILVQLPDHVTGWGQNIQVVEGGAVSITFTRTASLIKWILVGFTAIFAALLWVRSIPRLGDRGWVGWFTAAAYFAGGVLCIVGIARNSLLKSAVMIIAVAFLLQLGALVQIGNALRLAYVTRMPLLILTLTAALGPIALGPASALLGGLFNLEGDAWGLTLVALVAGLIGCATVAQINLVMYYGQLRLGDPAYKFLNARAHPALTFATGIAPALLLMGCAASISENISIPMKIAACFAGLLGAAGFALFAKVMQLRFTDKGTTVPPPPYLLFAPPAGSALDRYLQGVYDSEPPDWIRRIKSWWQDRTSGWSRFGHGEGYFVGNPRRLLSGHAFVIALAALSILVYLLIGLGKRYVNLGGTPQVPSLVFVLLAVLAASWLLSSLAFLLDRFRFPVLIAIVTLSLITGLSGKRDHIFVVHSPQSTAQLKAPADVLNTVGSRTIPGAAGPTVPVVIAAAGGGIQAAAWTARVLEGLHARDPQFGSRVALVSSISGGSTGALFYGAKMRKNDLQNLYRDASQASLDEVAWGLVMPDVGRLVLPFWPWPKIDRGWALEQTWIDRVQPGTLSEWSKDTADGKLPAFLINSTAVEKGQLISFATTQFPSAGYKGKQVTVRYDRLLNDFDLSVATAARMSATFPFVSPAAGPSGEGVNANPYHLVDGGYYDNYGLIGLTQWLDDALEGMQKENRPRRIGVLTIRSFPDDVEKAPSRWGWLRQFSAPLGAFLNVRSYAQWEGANEQLELLREKWRELGVEIVSFDVQYPEAAARRCGEPPLSWMLTRRQKQAVETAWRDAKIQNEVGRLLSVVGAPASAPEPPSGSCEQN